MICVFLIGVFLLGWFIYVSSWFYLYWQAEVQLTFNDDPITPVSSALRYAKKPEIKVCV